MAERSRVLLAVLVYGGRDVVTPCLASAVELTQDRCAIDVLVLDDRSPDEAWSEQLASLCAEMGISYHRNARNLGIPRNMTLAMLGASEGYDHVVLCNSDVVLGAGVIEQLAVVADDDPSIGSVTAWSNNVSIYSLKPAPDDLGADSADADLIDETLRAEFGDERLEIPVGVGFCLLLPVRAVSRVGVMDPIFGRGYCEEVDWCLRASEHGMRNVLALGGFAYHRGNVSAREAGLLGADATTEWAHEAIIDRRFPDYRHRVQRFIDRDALAPLRQRAADALIRRWLARGWELTVGAPAGGVEVVMDPVDGSGRVHAFGFQQPLPWRGEFDEIAAWCGGEPNRVNVRERSALGDAALEWARRVGIDVGPVAPYRLSV